VKSILGLMLLPKEKEVTFLSLISDVVYQRRCLKKSYTFNVIWRAFNVSTCLNMVKCKMKDL